MHIYWREGISELSLNEVCRRLNTPKPVVYREYGGEDGLKAACLDRYWNLHMNRLHIFLATAEGTFADQIDALVDIISGDVAGMKTAAGCLSVKMRSGRQGLGPLAHARVEQLERDNLKSYRRWLRRAEAARVLSAEADLTMLARYVDAQIVSAFDQKARGAAPKDIRFNASLALSVLLR